MTDYRVCETPDDYMAVRFFFDKWKPMPGRRISFPTIYAARDGKIIGGMATQPNDQAVLVGDFYSPSAIVSVRLVEKYDIAMRNLQIKTYLIPVDKKQEGLVKMTARLFNLDPWVTDDENVWFKRELH